jgi:hypothetical protein
MNRRGREAAMAKVRDTSKPLSGLPALLSRKITKLSLAAGIPGPVVNDLGCGATFRHNSHEWLSKGPRPPGYAN